jgi:regulator of RNase E activity RraA
MNKLFIGEPTQTTLLRDMAKGTVKFVVIRDGTAEIAAYGISVFYKRSTHNGRSKNNLPLTGWLGDL